MTRFELGKIWRKKSYILAAAVIFVVNLFLLWYRNLSDGGVSSLAAYKSLGQKLEQMTEQEKYDYIVSMKQKADDYDDMLLEHFINSGTAADGSILTDLSEEELDYADDIYEEIDAVYNYQAYLQNIQDTRNKHTQISIFASEEGNTFSGRNIEKSAKAYEGLSGIRTEYYPSKGVTGAVSNFSTDLLMLILTFYFVGILIGTEREKGLFHLTRATVYGRGRSILSKINALFIHSLTISMLLYGSNIVFFSAAAGLGNLGRSIQSAAPYMESTLQISVLELLLLSILTKALAVFAFGLLLTAASVVSRYSFVPYLTGGLALFISAVLYIKIPAYSSFNWLKYINFAGLMKTDHIYGGYMNFNFFQYPVSRLFVSWMMLIIFILVGIGLTVLLFLEYGNADTRKLHIRLPHPSVCHGSLLRHEAYKLLVMNKGFLILVIFIFLSCRMELSVNYTVSPQEAYYQDIMMELSGELNDEKESLIREEQERYEAAFAKIDEIDERVAMEEVDALAGERMKAQYYSELAFYPSFRRVMEQYENVKENDSVFLYDTGYLYLFGKKKGRFQENLLLLNLCLLLLLGNAMAMEHENKSLNLLGATSRGRRSILKIKTGIGLVSACMIAVAPWICKILKVSRSYPVKNLFTELHAIPACQNIPFHIPVLCWLLLLILGYIILAMLNAVIVLILSEKTKSHLMTLFISAAVLVVPLVLVMALQGTL